MRPLFVTGSAAGRRGAGQACRTHMSASRLSSGSGRSSSRWEAARTAAFAASQMPTVRSGNESMLRSTLTRRADSRLAPDDARPLAPGAHVVVRGPLLATRRALGVATGCAPTTAPSCVQPGRETAACGAENRSREQPRASCSLFARGTPPGMPAARRTVGGCSGTDGLAWTSGSHGLHSTTKCAGRTARSLASSFSA